ncbi:MAG TPA: lysylphosphatidylglycerol synthase transmembrane domain-containing protein [Bacteroidales bacterium]|nr:lysylphosphatidylglycerol synthase transmembrane domain-containing protein [Bacteroidales bacterium]HPR58412.1 lysylphosphatidylglycerol synthase transmembrane domain-containing protein [Bacteroidales bacterium]HRW96801.1 lysylphosphatidylglycerol synthase transmembrane domain-containing protein [Bacteroidales bacterium]
MKKNLATAFKILFFLAIGIFFIWIFLHKLTPDQKNDIWESFISANYLWVILSIFLGIFSHIVRAYRWNSLLEPMGYHPNIKNTFFAVMVGYLANTAVPRLGEVTRCGVLNKYEKIPLAKSLGTVLVERSLDLLVFLILFTINLIIFYDKLGEYFDKRVYQPLADRFQIENSAGFLLLIILGIAVVLLLVFLGLRKKIRHYRIYKVIRELISGFWHGLWAVTRIKRPLMFVFQSFLIWLLYYLMIYICFFAMPQTSHLGFDAALSLLMFGSIGIMVVQGGIGIYPLIIAETLILYDISTTYGYALGWLSWTAQTLMIVIVGLLSLLLLPVFNKNENYAKT